jgi:serine/threonine protein kinase
VWLKEEWFMPVASRCPDLPQWQCLVLGDLSEQDAERLVGHLAECRSCSDIMRTLKSEDTLVALLRASGRTTDGPRHEQVAELIERVKGLRLAVAGRNAEEDRSSWTTVPPGGTESGPLDIPPLVATLEMSSFLRPGAGPDELGRLGGYRVLAILGQGGMGVVFRAEDLQLKRSVALKAMRPALIGNDMQRQRFLREAQAMAAVKHDHVVTIYQVDQDHGVPYLAMEFLEGETLEERLQREVKLAMPEVLRIGREVALGLAAAHKHGLIHRDIKPANIWLEELRGRVKILDFGLARAAGPDSQLTQSGIILGTPAYMAPEQARAESVDARCDLFSLGCVLYRACTGTMPFKGTDMMSTLMAVAMDTPRPPRELNPAVSPALAELLRQLLAKDPAERPASATAVAEALENLERQQPASVPPPLPPAAPPRTRPAPPPRPSATSKLPAPSRPSAARPAAASYWRWAALGLALAVALVVLPLGFLFGPGVVRYVTNKGELVVQVDDPDVEIQVKQNNLFVTDRTTKRVFVLAAVAGEIEVYEKESGLKLATKKFTLTRGGRETVRVTFEPKQPDLAKRPVVSPRAVALFNGKDLTGWEAAGASGVEDWLVKEEQLTITNAHKSAVGWLLTERNYTDFVLRLEFRTQAGAKSGIALRGAPGLGVVGMNYPLKVQIVDPAHTQAASVPTGSMSWADGGNRYAIPDRKVDLKPGWNQMEIEMRGQRVLIRVNGIVVSNLDLDQLAGQKGALAALKRPSGRIGLQKYTGVVAFRKIEIEELPSGSDFFDGKTLDGWVGDPRYWKVEDGAIIGRLPEERRAGKTFLYTKKKYSDFELQLQVRMRGGKTNVGNSGVQIRSTVRDPKRFVVIGPQCKIGYHGKYHWGSLLTEPKGEPCILASTELVDKVLKPGEFNDYSIRCVGKWVTIRLNGQTTVDAEFRPMADEGVIAWQLHGWHPGMEVVFRNIRFKDLSKAAR